MQHPKCPKCNDNKRVIESHRRPYGYPSLVGRLFGSKPKIYECRECRETFKK